MLLQTEFGLKSQILVLLHLLASVQLDTEVDPAKRVEKLYLSFIFVYVCVSFSKKSISKERGQNCDLCLYIYMCVCVCVRVWLGFQRNGYLRTKL